jgi:hypothetical protein
MATRASTILSVGFSKNTVKLIREIKEEWPKRLMEARGLFLLDVGNYMMKRVMELAPEIEFGGETHKWADDLRIGLLDEGEDLDVIAIYLASETAEIKQNDKGRTVLYFRSHNGSPKWISTLTRYGPWPVEMVPVEVFSSQAKVISRKAREDEISALYDRIYRQKRKIELELLSAGARSVHVGYTEHGIGLMAHVDIGYNVLRKEFGFDGEAKHPHWRPAFKDTKGYAKKAFEKVVEYIETGNEDVFDLPDNYGNIDSSVVRDGEGFSREIAPFMR